MLSQQLIGKVAEGWSKPSLTELFQEWWYLILLALLVVAALSWFMTQLVKTDLELRRAMQAAARGEGGGEEAAALVAHLHMRRQTFIRPMLILIVVLFFIAYPVLKYWYGLE